MACFVPSALTGLHARLLDADVVNHLADSYAVHPSVVFSRANAATLDRLAELVQSWTGIERANALCALAWNDDPALDQRFVRWADEGIDLDWPLTHAGWELLPGGSRRSLAVSKQSHRLEAGGSPLPVVTMEHSDVACRRCGCPLVVLLDLDLADEHLGFLGLSGERLRILTCILCTCWGPMLTEVDMSGRAEWSAHNQRPDGLDLSEEDLNREDDFEVHLGLGRACLTPVETFAFESHLSTLGGLPNWIQYPDYPICPRCDHPMTFLAQVDTLSDIPIGEGMIYAFLHAECGLASTWYQQT